VVVLIRSSLVPGCRHTRITGQTIATLIKLTQAMLGIRHSPFGCMPIPLDRGGHVGGHAPALLIATAEQVLRLGGFLFSRFP